MSAAAKVKLESDESKVTFKAQDSLPRLPIPDLESTLQKYLDVLEPLEDKREHAISKAAVDAFLQNEGPDLQRQLKEYATGQTSYIEQFWYDSYLNFDSSVVLNLNPFFLLEDDPTPARNNQVTRAASLVVSALCFVRAVRKEELTPDTVRGVPLDMYQYSRLFGTARVPTENGCHIAQDSGSKHIVVLCKGQFYWFDVLDDNSDLIMSEKDLTLNFQVIVDDAEETPIQDAARRAIGVLSTENRKIWAGLRDLLTQESGSLNAEALDIIDTSLFVLCLDYTEPKSSADLCGNMLCGTNEVVKGVQIGTCTNRWYDKLQIIVCKNGSAGINFEHTGVDGHTVLRFASDVYTDTILRFARSVNNFVPSLWTSASPDPSKRDPASFGQVSTTPHKLEWTMHPELSTALRFAETRLADLIHQNEFQTLEFSGYGKTFITSMGLSPDGFVQMAFQAAYYGLYGRVENTYEPAMTKAFFHGRTEAIRTVSTESSAYVRTFWADKTAAEKMNSLRAACEKHVAHTRECAKAQGQDRHLYALYCLWQRNATKDSATEPLTPSTSTSSTGTTVSTEASDTDTNKSPPTIFTSEGWNRLNATILSTSNCGNPSLRQFGFGPTSPDGYGIGYIIKDDSISICASSKHRQTSRFIDAIEGYFLECRRLLKALKSGNMEKMSRARELEGRVAVVGGHRRGENTGGTEDVDDDEDDDGLGGYGFFDAGMLKLALGGNKSRPADSAASTTTGKLETKTAEKEKEREGKREEAKEKHAVGKRLVLGEYQ